MHIGKKVSVQCIGPGFYTEQFYAVIPTLFPYFLLFCYPYIMTHYTPGRGKIVPRNVTLLVGEKLCRVM